MKRLFRHTLAIMLAVVITVGAVPLSGFVGLDLPDISSFFATKAEAAADYSGTCGENLTWELDTDTGAFSIIGTGDMTDYYVNTVPWGIYYDYIKSVSLPNGLTSICDFAFYNCHKLTSITIPESVISIGESAFSVTSLENVSISANVTEIGTDAFYSVSSIKVDPANKFYSSDEYGVLFNKEKSKLIQYPTENERTHYQIPDTVIHIAENAFLSSTNLTNIVIADSVETIGDYAFEFCSNLASISIPKKVSSIGFAAFLWCENLEKIIVDKNNEYYSSDEYGVLFDKRKNELIQYPEGNKKTGYKIPEGVTQINDAAFLFCDSLEEIWIPASIIFIGTSSFNFCDGLKDVYYYDTEEKWNEISIGSNNTSLENATIHYNYTDPHTHSYNSSSVTIEPTCTEDGIKTYACECGDTYTEIIEAIGHVSGEWEITVQPTETTSGSKVRKCTKCNTILETETIKATYLIYDSGYCGAEGNNLSWTFYLDGTLLISGHGDMADYDSDTDVPWETYLDSVTNIVIDYGVTSVGAWAFSYSEAKRAYISDSVSKIGNAAFGENRELVKVEMSNNITEIGEEAFAYCSFYYVDIPNTIKSIGDYAFGCCDNLQYLHIPTGISFIGEEVLYNSDNAYLCSDSETSCAKEYADLNNYEFKICENHNVDFYYIVNAENNAVIVDYNHSLSGDIMIPSTIDGYTVRGIAENAFSDGKFTSITIPETVLNIGEYAFMGCEELVKVNLGNGVKSIGDFSFCSCCKLENIVIPNSVTTIGYGVFGFCDSLKYIHVSESVTTIGADVVYSCNAYICSDTEDCYAKEYAEANGIDFVLCKGQENEEHIHSYTSSITTQLTCTTDGVITYTCDCGDTYTEVISATGHTSKTITIPSSCTTEGATYQICEECGESLGKASVIPTIGHTAGEWETILDPTATSEGKKIKKCVACGKILEEEAIPIIETITVTDKKSDISLTYHKDDYSGNVNIVVEESFDGAAFNLIDTKTNSTQSFVYDITMTVDGVETQPDGKITVKIPLPDGYDPAKTFVYHVDTSTSEIEKMLAEYIDGYMVFETTHFSYYALVEEYNGTAKIRTPSTTTISYGDSIILHADLSETLPSGWYIEWTASNSYFTMDVSADGTTCKISPSSKGDTTFTATIYDADGNAVSSDKQVMTSKAGFFQKIIAFFKKLFGLTKTIPQIYNGIF